MYIHTYIHTYIYYILKIIYHLQNPNIDGLSEKRLLHSSPANAKFIPLLKNLNCSRVHSLQQTATVQNVQTSVHSSRFAPRTKNLFTEFPSLKNARAAAVAAQSINATFHRREISD